jgi:transposase-like protein
LTQHCDDPLNPGYPPDVIALVVLWRLRYKLALRDLPEMFAQRGMVFSYEAVRDWEAKLTPALAEDLRRRRCGKAGCSWYVDETSYEGHCVKRVFIQCWSSSSRSPACWRS